MMMQQAGGAYGHSESFGGQGYGTWQQPNVGCGYGDYGGGTPLQMGGNLPTHQSFTAAGTVPPQGQMGMQPHGTQPVFRAEGPATYPPVPAEHVTAPPTPVPPRARPRTAEPAANPPPAAAQPQTRNSSEPKAFLVGMCKRHGAGLGGVCKRPHEGLDENGIERSYSNVHCGLDPCPDPTTCPYQPPHGGSSSA